MKAKIVLVTVTSLLYCLARKKGKNRLAALKIHVEVFSNVTLTERISNNATRCQLNKQSLDISAINHIVLGTFTIVNFAFILPPLPPQQTRSVFTIVK